MRFSPRPAFVLASLWLLLLAMPRLCAAAEPPTPPARVWPPFTRSAIAAVVGTTGIGLDFSTTLSAYLNVRVGATYLGASSSFVQSGYPIDATVRLASGRAMVDWFPNAGGFHVSLGVLLPNFTQAGGHALIPAHQEIDLGGVAYRSDPDDPLGVTGALHVNRVQPLLTVGWGNPISRNYHKHFSFPTEIGVAYQGVPSFNIGVTGSACTTTCSPVADDPGFQQNLEEFTGEIKSDLAAYGRFYPIISTGVSYRF